jgi:polysaccharide pyruvyl transferase WcaK-like protein
VESRVKILRPRERVVRPAAHRTCARIEERPRQALEISAEEGREPEGLAGQGSSFPVDAALMARPVRERPEAEYRRGAAVFEEKGRHVRDIQHIRKIAFFGHFDSSNFGNESTLQAILHHLRCYQPDAEVTCISTGPEATIATHHIEAIPLADRPFQSWDPRNPLARVLRKICIGLPNQLYQWIKALVRLRHTDMVIIPGTGLLTDAYGLFNEGPYTLLKWSLMAKVCRCKLLFVSVGAGPLYGTPGRCFVKLALSLADYRSYRDNSSMYYVKGIGFRADNDRVYPDLAFSLPEDIIPHRDTEKSCRSVVGLGVMEYAGKYSAANPSDTTYLAYLENLAEVVEWLVARKYDVRLLSGDVGDMRTRRQLRALLRKRLPVCDEEHIIDEPIHSVEDLLFQIGKTNIVIATRFHNVLFALLCNKPVISLSFHHKCESLMSAMGLMEYCLDINDFNSERLIDKFCDLEINSSKLKPLIKEKTIAFRKALDEQYKLIFKEM